MIVLLVSLPRSGSTLLQNLISRNSTVETKAESWLYCALHSLGPSYTPTVFGKRILQKAKQDHIELYSQIAEEIRRTIDGKHEVFLEKTPRNLLVWDVVESIGYDHRIVLVRNPLAILASMSTTWLNGSLNGIHNFYNDLFYGTLKLDDLLSGPDEGIVISYEELVSDPDAHIAQIAEALGLADSWGPTSQMQRSKLGDPNFGMKYKNVSVDSIESWKAWINSNPIRYFWAARWYRYLRRNCSSDCMKRYLDEFPRFRLGYKGILSDFVGIMKLGIVIILDRLIKLRYRVKDEKRIWI